MDSKITSYVDQVRDLLSKSIYPHAVPSQTETVGDDDSSGDRLDAIMVK